VALATLGLAVVVAAQSTVVAGAKPSGLARSMNNNNSSLAMTADGAMWAVVYTTDSTGAAGGHLSLRRSTDHGKTWPNSYPLPNNKSHNFHHNNSGNIVAGRDCNILHVSWGDKSANASYWSCMYQAFDIATLKWVGIPVVVAKGSSANNQFWPVDIDVTPKGTVVICVSGHRSGGLGLGSWDCGLTIKKRSDTTFSTPLKNVRSGGAPYSQNACITAVDEVIHCCMKNNQGLYGIAYRAYDTETNSWLQTTQVMVGPNNNQNPNINAGNKSVIAADSKGGLYVLYITGGPTPNNKTMRLSYAKPGTGSKNADWTDIKIIPHTATGGTNHRNVATNNGAYPVIQGQNTTYRNYSLAVAADDLVSVVYSKAFEVFQHLYIRSYKDGKAVLPELRLNSASAKPYSFEWITGLRNGSSSGAAHWLIYGRTDLPSPGGSYPNGKVELWTMGSSWGRTVAFGTGCQGKLASTPRMRANDSRPITNTKYTLHFDRFPNSGKFFLAIGTKCSPLDLAFMGAPGCKLDIDFPIIVSLAVDNTGKLSIPWSVPNDSKLIGARFYAQSLAAAPGTNPAGAVTSNAITIIVSN
jgi:hypothetical protein